MYNTIQVRVDETASVPAVIKSMARFTKAFDPLKKKWKNFQLNKTKILMLNMLPLTPKNGLDSSMVSLFSFQITSSNDFGL